MNKGLNRLWTRRGQLPKNVGVDNLPSFIHSTIPGF